MAEKDFLGGNSSSNRHEMHQVQALVDQHLTALDAHVMTTSIRDVYVAGAYRNDPRTLVFVGTTVLDQVMHEGPSSKDSPIGRLRAEVGHKLRAIREVPDGLGEQAFRAVVDHIIARVADALYFDPLRKIEVQQQLKFQEIGHILEQ